MVAIYTGCHVEGDQLLRRMMFIVNTTHPDTTCEIQKKASQEKEGCIESILSSLHLFSASKSNVNNEVAFLSLSDVLDVSIHCFQKHACDVEYKTLVGCTLSSAEHILDKL